MTPPAIDVLLLTWKKCAGFCTLPKNWRGVDRQGGRQGSLGLIKAERNLTAHILGNDGPSSHPLGICSSPIAFHGEAVYSWPSGSDSEEVGVEGNICHNMQLKSIRWLRLPKRQHNRLGDLKAAYYTRRPCLSCAINGNGKSYGFYDFAHRKKSAPRL